jgi:hypothetical protein
MHALINLINATHGYHCQFENSSDKPPITADYPPITANYPLPASVLVMMGRFRPSSDGVSDVVPLLEFN